MAFNRGFAVIFRFFSSLKVTVVSLFLLFVVVFVGTLAQVNLGIYETQQRYFLSMFVWKDIGAVSVPVFPGVALIGTVLLLNLIAAIISRKLYTPKKLGLGLIHIGLVVLLFGSWLTSAVGIESQMAIKEGQTLNYSESIRDTEFVIASSVDGESQTKEVVVPHQLLKKAYIHRQGLLGPTDQLPFKFQIIDYYENAFLTVKGAQSAKSAQQNPSWVNQVKDIGNQIRVQRRPITARDDEVNMTTAYIEIFDKHAESQGIWLVSRALRRPQTVVVDGTAYQLSIRRQRFYYPFSVTLKDFSHDLYPGTTIPKNFSSLVTLRDAKENEIRDVLIYMNHPLRHKGHTFFQASYGEQNTLSIFQIVKNPGWPIPYLSCLIISLGLMVHFMIKMNQFMGRRKS